MSMTLHKRTFLKIILKGKICRYCCISSRRPLVLEYLNISSRISLNGFYGEISELFWFYALSKTCFLREVFLVTLISYLLVALI